jgi:hypothetical protein
MPATAYEEFVEFIASGTTPSAVIAFEPSAESKARVEDLIRRQKIEALSEDESAELKHYMEMEHIMRLAKARARKLLQAAN